MSPISKAITGPRISPTPGMVWSRCTRHWVDHCADALLNGSNVRASFVKGSRCSRSISAVYICGISDNTIEKLTALDAKQIADASGKDTVAFQCRMDTIFDMVRKSRRAIQVRSGSR